MENAFSGGGLQLMFLRAPLFRPIKMEQNQQNWTMQEKIGRKYLVNKPN
jgi:hypothetical protein